MAAQQLVHIRVSGPVRILTRSAMEPSEDVDPQDPRYQLPSTEELRALHGRAFEGADEMVLEWSGIFEELAPLGIEPGIIHFEYDDRANVLLAVVEMRAKRRLNGKAAETLIGVLEGELWDGAGDHVRQKYDLFFVDFPDESKMTVEQWEES